MVIQGLLVFSLSGFVSYASYLLIVIQIRILSVRVDTSAAATDVHRV